MPHTDARLALIHDWLTQDLGLRAAAPRAGIERCQLPPLFPRLRRWRLAHSHRHGRAARTRKTCGPTSRSPGCSKASACTCRTCTRSDAARGLLLLEDLGTTQYLSRLEAGDDPDQLYGDALHALADIQVRGSEAAAELAPYDREALLRELTLMPEWFCARHLELELTAEEREILQRGVRVPDRRSAGAADGVRASRLSLAQSHGARRAQSRHHRFSGCAARARSATTSSRCSRIATSPGRASAWSAGCAAIAGAAAQRGAPAGRDEREFLRWFDLIGVQRHIKVLGIFARLWYRDGKPGYLKDLPLTLEYVRDTCARYPELAALSAFVERRLVPGAAAGECAHRQEARDDEGHGPGRGPRRAHAAAHGRALRSRCCPSPASRSSPITSKRWRAPACATS